MDVKIVEGGGFRLLTADPIMIAVVRRCAQLERELTELRHHKIARYRTLRRDVAQIKRATASDPAGDGLEPVTFAPNICNEKHE
jgi:hypothetical protein